VRTWPGRLGAIIALVVAAAPGTALPAQQTDSITLVPGAQYTLRGPMSPIFKPIFGSRNRALWDIPLTLPLIGPSAVGGGLLPSGVTTGADSGVLLLRDPLGTTWQFRPLRRYEPRQIPPLVSEGVAHDIVLDLVSGRNPAGPMVAVPLAEAAGVPVQRGWLVVLATDSLPEPYRLAFGGQAGYLVADVPVADTAPAVDAATGTVIDTRTLMGRLMLAPPDRVDRREVLRQRLFAIFAGNLNPRWSGWCWEATRDSAGLVWRPLGRFPEQALANYNGGATRALRPNLPDLVEFGPNYPSKLTGTPDQLAASRWLIGPLDAATWDSVAKEIAAALTDSVIATAVAALPPPYQEPFGARLATILRSRRDHLPETARKLYVELSAHAEILGTMGPDRFVVDRTGPDTILVTLAGQQPREFVHEATSDVRLYLRGGADTVSVSGVRGDRPALKIISIGDDDADLLEVEPGAGGGIRLHDRDATFRVDPPDAATTDHGRYPDPLGTDVWADRLPRESGVSYRPTAWLEGSSGVGLVVGGGVVRTDWNGLARPYRSRMRLRAAYGTGADDGAVEFSSEFRFASTPLRATLDLAITGLALVRFYGYGNETAAPGSSSYYRSHQNQYLAIPGVTVPAWKHALLSAGLAFKKVETPLQPDHYVSVVQPYGTPYFGQTGVTAGASWDTRDVKGAPHSGVFITLDGSWYPILVDGTGSFGDIEGAVSTYVTPRGWDALTIATRIAGKATLGPYPLHEAAFLGGGTTVRGLPDARYAGDQSLFGNLDLRVRLFRTQAVAHWDFGVLFLADVGRVFLAGESSRVWHPSVGGGLWLGLLDRSLVANVNIAGGAGQGTFIRFGGGFVF
jgi:hypothetical protein